ncbi:hypothetical protein AVEN_100858-1 [Araneus ventricosus]|uniref:t-SNARE coiled-coil homology domain-containing protein n=1 Tax=Araneus ventricosus TaxID=182803 RepID=A0A4Y2AW77_ARAVE|nr:hypothetical protein AVEN_100858-1 [Araneus ventricosus]
MDVNLGNRTKEFQQIILILDPSCHQPSRLDNKINAPNDFSVAVKRIHENCEKISQNFQELQLIPSEKLFVNNFDKCNSSVSVIKERLRIMGRDLTYLGPHQYSVANKQHKQHCELITLFLKQKHATLSNELKQFLEKFCGVLKSRHQRMKLFHDENIPTSLFPETMIPTSVLLEDETKNSLETVDRQIYMDSIEFSSPTDQLTKIESTVVEVGEILKTIAIAVEEQGEALHRIDSNLETTAFNVDSAHSELLRYLRSAANSRNLMLKVFGVLIVTAVFVVVVI